MRLPHRVATNRRPRGSQLAYRPESVFRNDRRRSPGYRSSGAVFSETRKGMDIRGNNRWLTGSQNVQFIATLSRPYWFRISARSKPPLGTTQEPRRAWVVAGGHAAPLFEPPRPRPWMSCILIAEPSRAGGHPTSTRAGRGGGVRGPRRRGRSPRAGATPRRPPATRRDRVPPRTRPANRAGSARGGPPGAPSAPGRPAPWPRSSTR